jgi:hypothetical protein
MSTRFAWRRFEMSPDLIVFVIGAGASQPCGLPVCIAAAPTFATDVRRFEITKL